MKQQELQNYFLLDVRTPQEFSEARIPNSELIPMNEIPNNLEKLSRIKKPILIICRSGARATHVKDCLKENGISNTEVLSGGIIANKNLL
jgi:phage shock protein E